MKHTVHFHDNVLAEATQFMSRRDFARICAHLAEHPDDGSRMRDLPLFRYKWWHPPSRVWYYRPSHEDPRIVILKVSQGHGRLSLKAVREGLQLFKLVLELHKLLGP